MRKKSDIAAQKWQLPFFCQKMSGSVFSFRTNTDDKRILTSPSRSSFQCWWRCKSTKISLHNKSMVASFIVWHAFVYQPNGSWQLEIRYFTKRNYMSLWEQALFSRRESWEHLQKIGRRFHRCCHADFDVVEHLRPAAVAPCSCFSTREVKGMHAVACAGYHLRR